MGLFNNKKEIASPQMFNFSGYDVFLNELTAPTALKNPVVASIINIISNSIAALPVNVYKENATGKEKADFTIEAKLLSQKPNRFQNRFTFLQQTVQSLITKGEAFIFKYKSGKDLVELLPIAANNVTVKLVNGIKTYTITGEKQVYTDNEIIHILYNSLDGVTAYPQLRQHSETINHDNTLRKFSKKYFAQSANPSIYIQVESEPSEEELTRLKQGFSSEFTSVENTGKVPVLPSKFKINSLANNAKDYDLVDSLRYSLENLARCWNLPPSLIGSKDSTSYNSMEAESLAFLRNTLLPIIQIIEDALDLGLFYNTPFYCRFNTDSVLRSTTTERYNAYRTALGGSAFVTINEIRAREELNPVTGGNNILTMLNTAPITDNTSKDNSGANQSG